MSIEDIHYLKNNSIKQTCVILIDSKNRDVQIQMIMLSFLMFHLKMLSDLIL